jgi:hypothetical protein
MSERYCHRCTRMVEWTEKEPSTGIRLLIVVPDHTICISGNQKVNCPWETPIDKDRLDRFNSDTSY